MDFLELIARAKESEDFNLLCGAIPYAEFLGLTIDKVDGGPISRLAYDDKLIGNPMLPALHGGVVGALMEHAAIIQLMWEMETAHLPKIIDISVDFLRSAGPHDTFAKGVVTKHGRRVANVRVEAWQKDRAKLIAHAHAHFLVV